MTTLWLLIFIGWHSYPTVSGIATEQECERLYGEIKAAGWAATGSAAPAKDHLCVSYNGARP